jgi:hypothetical protein
MLIICRSIRAEASSVGKVKIRVGIKRYQEDVSLKSLKGITLPLTVDPDIDANHLLNEAVTKHSKHFRTFDCDVEYHLITYYTLIIPWKR